MPEPNRADRDRVVQLGSNVRHSLRVRSVFVSDVHLGSRGCRAEPLLDFLRRVRCDHLYLVGDIVDLWSLRRGFHWPESHTRVVRAILDMVATGTRVTYVPGNHDADLRELAGGELRGIDVRRDCIHVTADDRRLLVTHGDEFDGVVQCPQWLAAFGSTVYDLILALNHRFNGLRHGLGLPYWSLAGYLKAQSGRALRHIEHFEIAAAHAARRVGLDGIVCGHIHRHALTRIGGVLYANDGDWVENCTALIEDRNGRLAIWHWPQALVVEPLPGRVSVAEDAA
jgi:UDP-2,3-diacylglucosamine pyrophosphatase LpxH